MPILPERLNEILDAQDAERRPSNASPAGYGATFDEIERERATNRDQRRPIDPQKFDAMLDSDRALAARRAAIAAPRVGPDEMGRADAISRRRGIPPLVVADNLQHFAELDELDRLDEVARDTPHTGRFLADPRRMAMARDDVEHLAQMERSLRPNGVAKATPDPSFLEEIVSQAHGAWIRGKNYVSTFLLDPMLPSLVDDRVARGLGYASTEQMDAAQAAQRFAQGNREAAGVERLSEATRAQQQEIADAQGWAGSLRAIVTNPRAVGVTVAQSLGQGGPGLLATAGASVMGPGATAAAAGGSSFAIEYGNAVATAMQREGVDDTDPGSIRGFLTDPAKLRAARGYATKRGVPVAMFDALTAGLAGRLMAAARPTVASVAARTAGETALQAGGGAAGEATAQAVSGDKFSPSDILMEAVAEIPTAVTEVPGNYMHARETARQLMDSSEDAARLQEFTAAAGAAKLGERSPQDLEAFVGEATGEPIYLAADVAKELFQSANLNPTDIAEQLTGSETAWAEADATGGDLVIPAAKWASIISRLPNARAFADAARLSPEALSAAQLKEASAAAPGDTKSQPTPDPASDAVERIQTEVAGQLAGTGLYSLRDAERQAKLYGAVFGTMGQNLGMDPWALFEPFALEITHDETAPRGARGLFQRAKEAITGTRTLDQPDRGRIRLFEDGRAAIDLFEKADRSTFLHESGHLFWEVFAGAAKREDAPENVRHDFAAALQWFGVESPDQVTDEHLEQWARGFEHYLAEGKAPTPELQSLFARFQAWLLGVYRNLRALNVTLTPEVRGVFDRLLATQDEITAAQERQGMAPMHLGAEPAALGITPKQWADYVALHAEAATQGARDADEAAAKARRQESEGWYAEERSRIREEVQSEVDGDPGVRALRILTGAAENAPPELEGLKLDAGELVANYGKDTLRAQGVARDGGVPLDTAAAMLEFPSGDALVQALVAGRDRLATIDQETDSRMRVRYPEPDLPDLAIRAVHNDRRGAVLDAELAMLAQLAEQPKPNRTQLRAMAVRIIGRQKIRDIRPNAYLVAERRAARNASEAAGRGEYARALVTKRQQVLNAALYSEATIVRDAAERQANYAASLDRPAARKRFGKAGLLEPLDEILEHFAFRPMSDRQRSRNARLRDWFDGMRRQGIEPQVPEAVLEQIEAARLVHYRDLTAEQFAGLVDVLRQLDHQAHEAQELRLAGDKYDLDTAAGELSQAVRLALKDRGAPPASEVLKRKLGQRGRRAWRAAGAMLLRLRTIAGWVDGAGNTAGPFYRMLIRPLDRAQAAYLDAMKDYGQRVIDLFDKHYKTQDLSRTVWIASIRENLAKSDILAVALNTGNASNLQRMQEGRKWGDIQMMEILGHMTKEDWDFVQATWDTLESLWPQIQAQQERLTGVAPPKVEPRSVTTRFGRYRGGYYPLVYDRDSTQWRAFVDAESDSFFDPMAMMTLPPNGHTKERVHRARLPVKLDLAVIPSHLSSILKDLTHRETLVGIRKLMKHHDSVAALNDTLGPEYLDMLEDKLRIVATDQVTQEGRSFKGVRNISRGVRRHVGLMAMGFNVVTGLKQIAGISNSMGTLSERYGKAAAPLLLQGYQRMLRPGSVDAIMALSGEMRHRIDTADADIRNAVNRHTAGQMKSSFSGKLAHLHDGAIAHAYIFIRYLQTYLVDIPLWLAANEGALRTGMSEDAAVAAADDAVITAQGGGSAKDTALIEGNIPVVEWLTMFYSYGSAYLNQQITLGRDIGKAVEGGPARLVAEMPLLMARASLLMVLPVILDDLVDQAAGSSDGPGDDDSLLSYYGARVFGFLFYGVPLLRDLASSKFGYRLSPAQSIGDAYNRLAHDIERHLHGDTPEARKVVRDAVSVTGYTVGLPLAGPWRHVDYMWRVFDGEEQPQTIPEFAAAAAVGKREQR